jgi:hypothetical protein
MANIAEDYRVANHYDFIATGDVLEQRGFSQSQVQLRKVIKLIDNPEKILRPLSAKMLDITKMEQEGLVNREDLLAIHGKSRKQQYELLEKYGLKSSDVESPAGGCLLAEQSMKNKLMNINTDDIAFADFSLFKVGRHVHLQSIGRRLIMSRNKEEMDSMLKYKGDNYTLVKTNKLKSPIAFIELHNDDIDFYNVSALAKKRFNFVMSEVYDEIKSRTTFIDDKDKEDFELFIYSSGYNGLQYSKKVTIT